MSATTTLAPKKGEAMQVDGVVELSSPTEIAEDDSEIDPPPDNNPEHAEQAKKEKRKRVTTDSGVEKREEEDEFDSPSKRALRAGDAPLTGNEIRALLFEKSHRDEVCLEHISLFSSGPPRWHRAGTKEFTLRDRQSPIQDQSC